MKRLFLLVMMVGLFAFAAQSTIMAAEPAKAETKAVQPAAKKVSINKAKSEELQTVKGIGPAIADAIIKGRPYKKLDDLLKVKGIGDKKFEEIKPYVAL